MLVGNGQRALGNDDERRATIGVLWANAKMNSPTAAVEVVLLRTEEGGRRRPPKVNQPGYYRPHFVVQDRDVRVAKLGKSSDARDEYLGVTFVEGPKEMAFGESARCTVALAYFPDVSYSKLIAGATFTIREGAQVVGHGVVLECAETLSGGQGGVVHRPMVATAPDGLNADPIDPMRRHIGRPFGGRRRAGG